MFVNVRTLRIVRRLPSRPPEAALRRRPAASTLQLVLESWSWVSFKSAGGCPPAGYRISSHLFDPKLTELVSP